FFRATMAPENWRIWSALRNIAILAGVQGRVAEGLALLDSAIVLAGPGESGYLIAQRVPLLLRLGRPQEALGALTSAEARLGHSSSVSVEHRADLHRYASMIHLATGHPDSAEARLRLAVALSSSPVHACLLGVALTQTGRASEAGPMLAEPCRRYVARGT